MRHFALRHAGRLRLRIHKKITEYIGELELGELEKALT